MRRKFFIRTPSSGQRVKFVSVHNLGQLQSVGQHMSSPYIYLSQCNMNKGVLLYVEQTVLFCVSANSKCFYCLIVGHLYFDTFCVLCMVKVDEQRE